MKSAFLVLWRPDVFPWIALSLGLVFGSFLNVIIYRMPPVLRGEQSLGYLAWPRSSCPWCGHGIRWFENVPVLSYLVLRGRCSSCQTHIPGWYLLVEVLSGGLWGLAAFLFGVSFLTVFLWTVTSAWIVSPFLADDIRRAFKRWLGGAASNL